jgi:LAO/AO transport system kinase
MYKKVEEYVKGIISGDRHVLAKAITLVESTCASHRELSKAVINQLVMYSGNSARIGITGVPGVGKSTFIESFGMMLVNNNHKLAVLAIDPSSSLSGGSIMADKTRMETLAAHPYAFIRPSPSGGNLGGVARMTRETVIICEAAGFDTVIVETVGVGQSEVAVASMVDFFLVLMLADAGDDLQGIKKGVLEMADALAINKADGDNILKANKARKMYETTLHILSSANSDWIPPVLICSATTGLGLKEIWNQIMLHQRKLSKTGKLTEKRCKQSVEWMWSLIEKGLRDCFLSDSRVKAEFARISESVECGKISPTVGAEILLSSFCTYVS